MLVRAVDDAAGDAGVVVVLQPRQGWEEAIVQGGSSAHSLCLPWGPCPVTRVPQSKRKGACVPACSHQYTLVLADGRARPKYFSCDIESPLKILLHLIPYHLSWTLNMSKKKGWHPCSIRMGTIQDPASPVTQP